MPIQGIIWSIFMGSNILYINYRPICSTEKLAEKKKSRIIRISFSQQWELKLPHVWVFILYMKSSEHLEFERVSLCLIMLMNLYSLYWNFLNYAMIKDLKYIEDKLGRDLKLNLQSYATDCQNGCTTCSIQLEDQHLIRRVIISDSKRRTNANSWDWGQGIVKLIKDS